jgi:hypothetical protein
VTVYSKDHVWWGRGRRGRKGYLCWLHGRREWQGVGYCFSHFHFSDVRLRADGIPSCIAAGFCYCCLLSTYLGSNTFLLLASSLVH